MEQRFELPNFETLFINSKKEVFSITPFGKVHPENYTSDEMTDYQKALLSLDHSYSPDGKKFLKIQENGEEIEYDHSIVEKKGTVSKGTSIDLWLVACHFVILKSTTSSRCWLLHYDPLHAINSTNTIGFQTYSRPTYCDLNPEIPYEIADAHIGEDEKVDVFVFHIEKSRNNNFKSNMMAGNFDENILKKQLGEKHINGEIKYESLRRMDENEEDAPFMFDIKFYPEEGFVKIVRRNDKKEILNKSIYTQENLHEFDEIKTTIIPVVNLANTEAQAHQGQPRYIIIDEQGNATGFNGDKNLGVVGKQETKTNTEPDQIGNQAQIMPPGNFFSHFFSQKNPLQKVNAVTPSKKQDLEASKVNEFSNFNK